MMQINRRALLASTAALTIAACSPGTNPIPVWVAALQSILTVASGIIPQLQAVGLSGPALTDAQNIINDIENVLKTISNASTAAQGASVLQQVETYINALAPIVLTFAQAIPGGSIVGLIVAALPAIELAVNFVASLLSPQAQALASTAPPLPASAKASATDAKTTAQQYLQMLEQMAAAKK